MGVSHKRELPPAPSAGQLPESPPLDSPPWFCLSKPGAPVVLRRYHATTRTCQPIGDDGRWLLESCLVPRTTNFYINELHLGWKLAVGDVQPGWCIVYAGHRLWFPQRVVSVELLSQDWQRVWTISDAQERNVWETDDEYDWDNGFKVRWSFDQMGLPRWGTMRDPGPWWPLQSEPLDPDTRRFILDTFDLAVECPRCGEFGKRFLYGMTVNPPSYVIPAGCIISIDSPSYGCDCGFEWNVDEQGRAYDPAETPFGHGLNIDEDEDSEEDAEDFGTLNYDFISAEPYGPEPEKHFQDLQEALWDELGGEVGDDGMRIDNPELDIHVYGSDYFEPID